MNVKKFFLNNIFLKVISVVLGFIVWLVIVNISDPTTSVTMSGIPVSFINESSLTNKGYKYEIAKGETISVDVSGPKSVITNLSTSDISATVDLDKMSDFSDYADISVSVIKNGNQVKSVQITPRTSSVKLNITNRKAKDFTVKTEVKGIINSNYTIEAINVDPSNIRIVAKNSDVNKIAEVKAILNVKGASESISKMVEVSLYDKDGQILPIDAYAISNKNVNMTVSISPKNK